MNSARTVQFSGTTEFIFQIVPQLFEANERIDTTIVVVSSKKCLR